MSENVTLNQPEEKIIKAAFESQQKYKFKAKNLTLSERLKKLARLKNEILRYQKSIQEALLADFGRGSVETDLIEIMPVLSEINHVSRHLKSWMSDEVVKTPALYTGTKSWVRYEGRGNCLLIGPWNYPFQLVIYPLVSAIAAGNTLIIKPSEFTPEINKVLKQLLSQVFEPHEVFLVEGDYKLANFLLDLPFDHIFFTGSTAVGKIVMEKAAKNLASVTLELGGKSPVIVDKNSNLDDAATKIAWGKYINAGQTCIAPDTLYIHQDVADIFVKKFKQVLARFSESNPDKFTQIINQKHFSRLKTMLEEAKNAGAVVELGAGFNESERRIEMTLLSGIPENCQMHKEEIFGPILPMKTFKKLNEVTVDVLKYGYPLALYIFSKNEDFIHSILENTCSGGVAINDVILQNANHNLPFGGVGHSGMGHYHGIWGFREFSHKRAVLKRKLDLGMQYFYPPYTDSKKKIIKSIFDKFSKLL